MEPNGTNATETITNSLSLPLLLRLQCGGVTRGRLNDDMEDILHCYVHGQASDVIKRMIKTSSKEFL